MPLLTHTTWKVSKYGAISGLYFPAFGLNTDQKSLYIWTLFTQRQKRFQSLLFFYHNKNLCQLNMKFQPGNDMLKVNNKNTWTRCEVSSKFNNKDIRTMPLAYQIFISLQMIALQKLWKMLFISLKSSFCSRDIHIFVFPSSPLFLPVTHYFKGWSKINLKVCDVIRCLNKNLIITHFAWYLKKEKRRHWNFVHCWSIK